MSLARVVDIPATACRISCIDPHCGSDSGTSPDSRKTLRSDSAERAPSIRF